MALVSGILRRPAHLYSPFLVVELPRILGTDAILFDLTIPLRVLLRFECILIGEDRIPFPLIVNANQARAVKVPLVLARIELKLLPRGREGPGSMSEGFQGEHCLEATIVVGNDDGLAIMTSRSS